MLPHPSTNFETRKYYQNKTEFSGVYTRSNLSKIKDGTHIINLDEYESIRTQQIAIYVNAENAKYFDSFGVKNSKRNLKIQYK